MKPMDEHNNPKKSFNIDALNVQSAMKIEVVDDSSWFLEKSVVAVLEIPLFNLLDNLCLEESDNLDNYNLGGTTESDDSTGLHTKDGAAGGGRDSNSYSNSSSNANGDNNLNLSSSKNNNNFDNADLIQSNSNRDRNRPSDSDSNSNRGGSSNTYVAWFPLALAKDCIHGDGDGPNTFSNLVTEELNEDSRTVKSMPCIKLKFTWHKDRVDDGT